ncbi:MAG: helix-turn-helix transcriptional regulator, partial [Ruminococcaceae bacterium]|nr:helix-turn-helix transcriptional regulator [Oscillospiraceae bacterium]
QNYMVTFLNSDITDWKYVMIIPASSYLDSTNSLKNILLLGWIIALFAGLFIIYKFTMRNYGEIKKIVNLFGEHKDIKNELEYINKNILESISTNEKLNKIISQVKDDKKDAYLRSILRGESLNSSIQKSEDIKNYFEYENYIVAAISVDKYENIFFEESIRNQSEKYYDAYFIIANTLSELLGAEIIRIDGIITAIINFPGNTGTEDILNTLKQAVEFYKEKFNLTVTISLGTIKFSEKEVNISYKEAQDALLYKFIYGTGSVIDYKLIEGLSGTVVYSLEKEQLIINYAKTGDFTEICNIINEIFDTNFKNKVVPVQIAKCFIFDVLNTILRILPKIDEDNEEIYLLDESSIIDEIMDSNTITEMKESILNVFKKICEYNGSVSANNAANLSKKIEQYIRLNFKNPDINVSIIADYFGLSGAYISKLFRIQTGISILDYIHKERIAVAKEMLKQGKIVAQVAAELGYNNSNAFIRVFKRYEKITPGQYCNHFGKGE